MKIISDLEDFDFEDCYDSITEKNNTSAMISGGMATMEIAFLTYICEKFSKNIDIIFSKNDTQKAIGILKKMGLEND